MFGLIRIVALVFVLAYEKELEVMLSHDTQHARTLLGRCFAGMPIVCWLCSNLYVRFGHTEPTNSLTVCSGAVVYILTAVFYRLAAIHATHRAMFMAAVVLGCAVCPDWSEVQHTEVIFAAALLLGDQVFPPPLATHLPPHRPTPPTTLPRPPTITMSLWRGLV